MNAEHAIRQSGGMGVMNEKDEIDAELLREFAELNNTSKMRIHLTSIVLNQISPTQGRLYMHDLIQELSEEKEMPAPAATGHGQTTITNSLTL